MDLALKTYNLIHGFDFSYLKVRNQKTEGKKGLRYRIEKKYSGFISILLQHAPSYPN